MIRPEEMKLVRIIAPSSYMHHVIEALHGLRILHIVDYKGEEKSFGMGEPFKEAGVYSQQLVDLRAMISKLQIKGNPKKIKITSNSHKFQKINKDFKELVVELDKLKNEENEFLEEADNPLTNLGITQNDVKEFKSLAIFAGAIKSPIKSKLEDITDNCLLKQIQLEKEIAFVLLVDKAFEEKCRAVLNESGFTEYPLPYSKKDVIEDRLSKIRKDVSKLINRLDENRQNSQFLVDYEFSLTQATEKAEAPLRFATSKNTFVSKGWVPTKKAEKLKKEMEMLTNSKVSVEFLAGLNPPTELKNPSLVNNFEFLTNMYSLPKNYELDPTILMFLIFPLFFGFMLGDVGYGIITFLAMLVFERLSPSAKPLIRIVTMSSLATIAFGFIFGEFFGHEFIHPLLNRVHDVQTMMLISVGIGVAHINLGFILGLINELKHHNFLEAFFRKGSWITLQISVAVFWLGYSYGSIYQITGALIAVVSLLMITKSEGFLRIIEIPGILSNILSYIRLYAIGLASVALASIVNELASGLFANGGFSIIAGVFLLFVGHFINLLLGLIGPFLHSMRLHYVEFFQKFYEGGGYRYNPFGTTKIGG